MKHLAIFSSDLAQKILTGEKSIESRFSKAKIAPFEVISSGDLVYIKPTGKDITGQFRVKKVIFFDGLTKEDFKQIRDLYGKEISADDSFWKEKADCKYGTLIFIGEYDPFLTSPIKIKKSDQRGWVVLD